MSEQMVGTIMSAQIHASTRESPQVLPTGTVTFLFTDIEGSTPLWEQHPREMAEALQVHNAALRKAIEANRGIIYKTVGDAYQSAFHNATQALEAAIQGQRLLQAAAWNMLGPLAVRMGLHTGEAELDPGGDEYAVSHAKNRVSRIMSVAHGGQILLSQETADLVRRALPEGVTLKDLGDHHLKGMALSERLFQASAPGLQGDYPPLVTAIEYPHNLPLQMTSFVGREKEILAVRQLLSANRLVTFTGVGGTGKTRLALRVAAEMLGEFEHGAWLVELAPLSDPELIPSTVAKLFGLRTEGGRTPQEALNDYFHSKHLLLVLDNCEHLIQEAARFAETALRAAPQVKVLATSREALGLAGEMAYPVPSLETPEPRHLPPVQSLTQFAAVRLFTERAAAVLPAFTLTDHNAPAVALICHRLDGIPLAIELAAARVKVLSAEQIASRLDDRFRLLTGGSRTALPRHQTLHALIDWSHELLSGPERRLFRCLSVFRGGWTLEAAEALCPCGREDSFDVLETMAGLVNKSLVSVETKDGYAHRYNMLETIRQYAQEKLLESGDAEEMRDLHMAYFAGFAEAMERKLHTRAYLVALEQMEADLDNSRTALDWALGGAEISSSVQTRPAYGLRLTAALAEYWSMRGLHPEWFSWLDKTLATPAEAGDLMELRARACLNSWHFIVIADSRVQELCKQGLELYRKTENQTSLALALIIYGSMLSGFLSATPRPYDLAAGTALMEEGIALFEQQDEPVGLGWAWFAKGYLANMRGDLDAMIRAMGRCFASFETAGDYLSSFFVKLFFARCTIEQGAYDKAGMILVQCLDAYRQIHNKTGIAYTTGMIGQIAIYQDDIIQAEALFLEALSLLDDLGIMAGVIWAKRRLACIALRQGQRSRARQLFLDSQAMGTKLIMGKVPGDPAGDLSFMVWMGSLSEEEGKPLLAARFLGAVEAILETFFKPLDYSEEIEYERLKARLDTALDAAALSASWAEGRKLNLELALEEGLAYCRGETT